jgi:hypothetical protein
MKLNKCVKAAKTTGSNIVTNDNGILSGPDDVFDFTAIKESKVSLESTVILVHLISQKYQGHHSGANLGSQKYDSSSQHRSPLLLCSIY